jgi:hypothetical protein
MRRAILGVLLLLLATTASARAIHYGTVAEPITEIEVDHDLGLAAADPAAAAGMTRTVIGRLEVFAAPNVDEQLRLIVHHRGAWYELLELGKRPSPPRYLDFDPGGAVGPPRVTAATADASLPLVRVDVAHRWRDLERNDTYILDFRGKPKVVDVSAERQSPHGACVAPDAAYQPRYTIACEWSAQRRDFVCTERREQRDDWHHRVAWRVFTLLGDKPIVRARDIDEPRELLSSSERTVAGEGVVERIPIASGIDFFAIASIGLRFELHGWFVDRNTKRVIPMMTSTLEGDVIARKPDGDEQPFTFDREPLDVHRVSSKRYGAFTLVAFTVREQDAIGLYWLGYDDSNAGAWLLRVATDAHEHLECNTNLRPPGASSIAITDAPFAALLRVEGVASERVDDTLEDAVCRQNIHVRWTGGFALQQVEPSRCAPGERRKLIISPDGTLTTADLPPAR